MLLVYLYICTSNALIIFAKVKVYSTFILIKHGGQYEKNKKRSSIKSIILEDHSYQLALGGTVSASHLQMLNERFMSAPSGPIVIGHQCELTGGFSSWGYWHDKYAKAAVKIINDGGGKQKSKTLQ